MTPDTLHSDSPTADIVAAVKAEHQRMDDLVESFTLHCKDQNESTRRVFEKLDELSGDLVKELMHRVPPWVLAAFSVASLIIGGLGTALAIVTH